MRLQIERMLKMQDEMNSIVNPEWRTQGWEWWRAIYMEAAELVDHLGWKWWKNLSKPRNMDQIHLELVDIFHFIMSDMLVNTLEDTSNNVVLSLIESAFQNKTQVWHEDDPVTLAEELITKAIITQRSSLGIFTSLCRACNLSFDRLYKLYIYKNVLNKFRQDHGYKEGTYIKDWSTSEFSKSFEDNDFLMSLELDETDSTFIGSIESALSLQYSSVVYFNKEKHNG